MNNLNSVDPDDVPQCWGVHRSVFDALVLTGTVVLGISVVRATWFMDFASLCWGCFGMGLWLVGAILPIREKKSSNSLDV